MYFPKCNIWANFSQQQRPILIWAELLKNIKKYMMDGWINEYNDVTNAQLQY